MSVAPALSTGTAAPADGRRTLYLVMCGSPRTRRMAPFIDACEAAGWNVCAILTPSACTFVDPAELEARTGNPVRTAYKLPDAADVLPPPDAIVVCPATFNTVNKLAAGIADTLATGIVCEAIGAGLPVVVAPSLTSAQAAHPAFDRSVAFLRAAGATVFYGPPDYEPVTPGQREVDYAFDRLLDALERSCSDARAVSR